VVLGSWFPGCSKTDVIQFCKIMFQNFAADGNRSFNIWSPSFHTKQLWFPRMNC
jgi:hypothetical protein